MEAKKHSNNNRNEDNYDFETVCRSCLSQNGLVNIFQLDYESVPFVDIFNTLFSVRISSNDGFPQNICEFCIGEVIRFHDFKKNYEKSEKILQQQAKVNKTPEVVVISDDIDIKSEHLSDSDVHDDHNAEVNELCEELEDLIKGETVILESVNTSKVKVQKAAVSNEKVKPSPPERKPRTFVCFCKRTFTVYYEYVMHRKEDVHSCTICNKKFKYYGLMRHMKNHLKQKKYECSVCLLKFRLKSDMTTHMRIHTGERPYICEICGNTFVRSTHLKVHKRTHTGEKPYLCSYCGKRFTDNSGLTIHKRSHTNEKPYVCAYCGKSFYSLAQEKFHRTIHTGETPYLCSYCGMKFRNSTSFKNHIQKMHGEGVDAKTPDFKIYKCKICQESFTMKRNLLRHNMVVHGVENFTCGACDKGFLTRSALKIHTRVHSGEKPFSCERCGRVFAQMSALKVHQLKHDKVKEIVVYTCTFCKKKFYRNANLKIHIRSHLGESPSYKCDYCPRGFYFAANLQNHKKKHVDEIK